MNSYEKKQLIIHYAKQHLDEYDHDLNDIMMAKEEDKERIIREYITDWNWEKYLSWPLSEIKLLAINHIETFLTKCSLALQGDIKWGTKNG